MTDVSSAVPAPGRVATDPGRARIWTFYSLVAATVLLFTVPMAPFLVIPVAWPFMAEALGVHQLHDVGVSTMIWVMVAGLLAQLRRPEHQVGGMQQVLLFLIVWVSLTAISRMVDLMSFGPIHLAIGLSFVIAALHPARAEVARIGLRPDPFVAALALIAAGPLLVYAWGQLRLDHSALPLVAHGGHWTAMGTLTASIVVLALLGATRPRGWRVPVWSAGAAALLFGTASAGLPLRPSSVGPLWGVLAAGWGIAFVVVAEMRYRRGWGRAS